MKTTRYFTLTLLIFVTFAFVPNSFAGEADRVPEQPQEQERPIVKVIYFYPNDVRPQPDIDVKLDTLLKDAQQVYVGLMEAHGFDRKTFLFETDTTGEVVVHHVKGKFNDAYYQNQAGMVWKESSERFDLSENIYLAFLDVSTELIDDFACGYGASHGSFAGSALIPASGGCFEGDLGVDVTAHELGHGLGLAHDHRPDVDANRIYLNTNDGMITSYCAAEWLDAHPAFNTSSTTRNKNTSMEMLEPVLESPPTDFRLRFNVSDPDGLHQAKLLIPKSDGDLLLRGCKRLDGAVDSTVEVVAKQLSPDTPSAMLRVIDVLGNYTQQTFTLNDLLPFAPSEVVSIADPHLATAIRNQIGSSITTHTILNLREFAPEEKGIEDLTGLEHAYNLRRLSLYGSNILDVSPLAHLTNLVELKLDNNEIIDISPLAHLTNLVELYLGNNEIIDISPLAKLTTLENLSLSSNQLTDISPLAHLTNLVGLYLGNNEIIDISPLTHLTKLVTLGLANNEIIDISPLTNLTKLEGTLSLIGNNISDVKPLSGLVNLEMLMLNDNNISDVSPLSGLVNLEVLMLDDNNISDVSPFLELVNLRQVNLDNNNISDVKPLADLVNIKIIFLRGNPIKNRQPLLELLRKDPMAVDKVRIYLKGRKPLPVTLSHFRAELADTGVTLKWTTESEIDNAGFYIYRSETKDGQFKVINPTIIQGAGTTSERNTYTWTDTAAKPNVAYYYRIEDISHAGVREQLATVRMRGFVSASGKLTTRWADLKTQE